MNIHEAALNRQVFADPSRYVNTFASRLAYARYKANMSLTTVAKHISTQPSTVSNYEAGVRTPDLWKIRILCEIYNVSADWLIGLTSCDFCNNPYEITTHKRFCCDNCRKAAWKEANRG